jgi:hypothetical protein
MVIEESTKTYWMHDSFEQVHIMAGRKRLTVLQIAQEGRQIPMDFKSPGSFDALKKFLTTPPVLKPRTEPRRVSRPKICCYISLARLTW